MSPELPNEPNILNSLLVAGVVSFAIGCSDKVASNVDKALDLINDRCSELLDGEHTVNPSGDTSWNVTSKPDYKGTQCDCRRDRKELECRLVVPDEGYSAYDYTLGGSGAVEASRVRVRESFVQVVVKGEDDDTSETFTVLLDDGKCKGFQGVGLYGSESGKNIGDGTPEACRKFASKVKKTLMPLYRRGVRGK